MSSRGPGLDIKFPVRARFPSEHIQAIGFAEVGPVFLTFAANGSIIKAEAELIDAPYQSMLIDSPSILRIFGQRGDAIDINVLHPSAKFRLDALNINIDDNGELDMASFDVARLVDITESPASTRYNWAQTELDGEGEVYRGVRGTFESDKGKIFKQQRGRPSREKSAAKENVTKKSVAKENVSK
jgi:hypothetical protein